MSSPSSSPIPSPVEPSVQQQQASRGRSRQVPPRSVRRVNEGTQDISAENIYDAVRFGKSAMVVSKPSAVEHGGKCL